TKRCSGRPARSHHHPVSSACSLSLSGGGNGLVDASGYLSTSLPKFITMRNLSLLLAAAPSVLPPAAAALNSRAASVRCLGLAPLSETISSRADTALTWYFAANSREIEPSRVRRSDSNWIRRIRVLFCE